MRGGVFYPEVNVNKRCDWFWARGQLWRHAVWRAWSVTACSELKVHVQQPPAPVLRCNHTIYARNVDHVMTSRLKKVVRCVQEFVRELWDTLNLWSHNYTSTGQHSLFTAPWTLKCVINIEDINIRIMDIVSRPSLTCTAPQRAQHDLVKAWNHLQTELTTISAKDFNQAALIPHCFNVD